MSASDTTLMQRCIALAKKGKYTASPNPMVGCVIIKNEEIVGEGWHEIPGQAHAEIAAFEKAGDKARGADLYVSLEPCCHQGKTGPCCDAVIAAGIAKVVFGMLDPNPLVAGKGVEKIKAAGIEVVGPVLEDQCAEINPGYIKRVSLGLPYVRCKLAMSLDGRTAMANGESKWITGAEARADVQKLRACSDALLTGVGTIVADDPSLNVRLEGIDYAEPLRVIVDSQLRTPAQAKTLTLAGEVILASAVDNSSWAYNNSDVKVKTFPNQEAQVDLKALMQYLAQEKQCNEVLLESGSVLAGAMLEAGLVDEVITYVAPDLMGSAAKPLFELSGLEHMKDKIGLEFISVEMLGKDCKMRSRVINV
jgi:diaminohydroxyphosphoribosylaminopyrimidine deaminase / 5-amino-6-(5-phosphoribosylamino)uracil reductase